MYRRGRRMDDSRFDLPPLPSKPATDFDLPPLPSKPATDNVPPTQRQAQSRPEESERPQPRRSSTTRPPSRVAEQIRARSQEDEASPESAPRRPQRSGAQSAQRVQLPPDAKDRVKPALQRLASSSGIYVKNEEVMQQSLSTLSQILSQFTVDELDALLISCTKAEREILLNSLRRQ